MKINSKKQSVAHTFDKKNEMLKSLIILSTTIFLSFNSYAYSLNKVILIGDIKSTISEYPTSEFRENVIFTLNRLGDILDTNSTRKSDADLQLNGYISVSKSTPFRYTLTFKLIKISNNKTIENHEAMRYKNPNDSVGEIVEKTLHEMREFNRTETKSDYFMPGAAFDIYQPRDKEIGDFYGPGVEFVFYSRLKHSSSNRNGPSRIKSYGKIGILNSTFQDSSDILMVSTGINLSFESKTDRKFLLPYFGLDLGGVFGRTLNTFQFTPLLGVQLFSTSKIIWSAQAGYLYSVKKFDQYSGYNFRTSLNVLLW